MSKVVSSYESVVRGVSEQTPQDRREGQHFAQDNFISDPVKGLVRRHGSINQDEVPLADLTPELWDAAVADTKRHKEFTFFVDGQEYALLYRTEAMVNPSVKSLTFAWCFNKDTRQFVPLSFSEADPLVEQLLEGGVSAVVNVGKYVYLAGRTIVPSANATDLWGQASNKSKLAVWVRGGAYSRTFQATLTKADGSTVVGEYKTKTSQYTELLDTSDIPATIPDPDTPGSEIANPEYQKEVNDRTNLYNSNVTKWIGEAAEDITPENIAAKIKDDLVAQGVTGLTLVGSTICINNTDIVEVGTDDGGDGALMRGVGNQVSAPELVSVVHYVGKVVKVRPKRQTGSDALYLKAVAQDGVATGFAEVRWIEAAGYEMTPSEVFVMGTVEGGSLHLASTAAGLAALAGGTHPTFKANVVGDDVSAPLPVFFGKSIDYLGLFQDRLVIGSGATLFYSRPGDYLNWFRTSAVTVDERDPIEMYALGSEGDTIVASTTFDRNDVFFGKRKQYTVNGRQRLTPQSASIVEVSAHKDAVDSVPQYSGNFVFYTKLRNGVASLHQIQVGLIADSPESFEVSQQLDTYLKGRAVQTLAITSPNQVFLRTEDERYALFTYAYLDSASGAERLFDAWSRWTWNPLLGPSVGISSGSGDVLSFTLRSGKDKDGDPKLWIVCDRFVMDTSLSALPYADSLRPLARVTEATPSDWLSLETDGADNDACVAFGNTSPYFLLGTPLGQLTEFLEQYPEGSGTHLWAGVQNDAFTTPTNPYVRDQKGKAILNGRLTLGRVSVNIVQSSGLVVEVTTANSTFTTQDFNGRLLGRASNVIGRQPIVSTAITATVGKEVRECTYTLRAKRWLPLTISSIEWTGQMFNNARRV